MRYVSYHLFFDIFFDMSKKLRSTEKLEKVLSKKLRFLAPYCFIIKMVYYVLIK